MKVVGHIPQTHVEEDVDTDDPKEAIRLFKEKYPDANIESINDDIVVGICEGCLTPIMESDGDTYHYSPEDSVFECSECIKENESRH